MASSVVAILFPNTTDADRMKVKLTGLQARELLQLLETMVIVCDQNGKVTHEASTPEVGTGKGAAYGSLVGVLIGSMVLMPIAGFAIGAVTGALAGHARKFEVDEAFKQALNDGLRPGTSALIVRVDQVQSEEFRERLARFLRVEHIHGQVLHTTLSPEAEQALQTALQA